MRTRSPAKLAACALLWLWLWLWPLPAAAQSFGQILELEIPLDASGAGPMGVRDRSRPELQPPPLSIAGMDVSASLDAALGSTSNVVGAESQRQADEFAEWQPQLIAALPAAPGRSAAITLNYDGRRYFDTPAKDQNGYFIGAAGNYGLGTSGLLYAAAYHQRLFEDQLAGTFPANGGGAVAIDQTHLQARASQGWNRVKWTGALSFDRLLYSATVTTTGVLLPQSYRDDGVLRTSSRLDYTLRDDTALFAQLSWRGTYYADGSAYADHSSHEWTAIAGLSTDVTSLVRLTGGFGGYWRQYDRVAGAPDFGGIAGLAWDMRGIYALTALSTLSLQTKREFIDGNVSLTPGYQATSLGMQLDHELLRNLLLSASVALESDRFRLIARQDHLHHVALWADYWISPRLLVKPRVDWLTRDSAGAAAGPRIPEFRTELALSVRG